MFLSYIHGLYHSHGLPTLKVSTTVKAFAVHAVPSVPLTSPWLSPWPSSFQFTIPYDYHSSLAIKEIYTCIRTSLLPSCITTLAPDAPRSKYIAYQTYPDSSSSNYKKNANQPNQGQTDPNSRSCLSSPYFSYSLSATRHQTLPSPFSLFQLHISLFQLHTTRTYSHQSSPSATSAQLALSPFDQPTMSTYTTARLPLAY